MYSHHLGNPKGFRSSEPATQGKTRTNSPIYSKGTHTWGTRSNRQTLRTRSVPWVLGALCALRGVGAGDGKVTESRSGKKGQRWREREEEKENKQEGGRDRQEGWRSTEGFQLHFTGGWVPEKITTKSTVTWVLRGQQQHSNLGQLDSDLCFFSLEQTWASEGPCVTKVLRLLKNEVSFYWRFAAREDS